MTATFAGSLRTPKGIFHALFGAAKEDVQTVGDLMRVAQQPLAQENSARPVPEEKPTEPFEIAHSALVAEVDGRHLTMRLYYGPNTRIERIIRVPTERQSFMKAAMAYNRVHIDPYTPDKARNAGLPFSLEGCLAFTKSMGLKSFRPHALATGQHDLDLTARLDADEARIQALRKTAQQPVHAPVREVAAPKEDEEGDVIGEATGVVASACDKRIAPPNRKPFWAFEVQVRDSRGEIHEFIGKDLKEKFQQRAFTVGDRIHIVKRQATFEIGDETSTKSRSKNFYSIRVLERGSV